MSLKKRNGIYLAGSILILLLILVYYISSRPDPLYGNDQASIKKILESISPSQNKEVEILEIKDIYGKRVVAFLNDNDPSYAEFKKDEEGNYQFSNFESQTDKGLPSFLIQDFSDQEEVHAASMMFITNQNNTISRLELTVNEDQVFEREFKLHQKAVEWIELPKSNEYRFKYKYYDENDKLID
ncbi:hypothetical protein QPK24_11820 [Paenibacillus polygoni]|uniref:DUF4825 domain-containing protein n=1 Tax=Paenibacillus polygoni TaxID=3050112 RepID=A0ABY8XCW5_9BACL|nr:hypothetical protein [Paenibacillus polygoni]WIV21310.1 hypothetical protein QPK24_11820 [Paenibacillus polygoni]